MKSKSPWFGSFQSIISQLGVGIGAANRHAHCPTWLFQAIFALKIEVRAINNANYNTNDLVFFCLWMVGEKFSPNNDIINYSKKICNEIGKRYCFWINRQWWWSCAFFHWCRNKIFSFKSDADHEKYHNKKNLQRILWNWNTVMRLWTEYWYGKYIGTGTMAQLMM